MTTGDKRWVVEMTDMIPTIEMNRQDGYADIDFTNPKSGVCGTMLRLNPRELIMLRDLLNKHFPKGCEQ